MSTIKMNSTDTLVLLLVSVLCVEVNCQYTEQTPIIGTNRETAYNVDRSRRFYLNTADPAPCDGTINGWRYCFYNPGNIDNNRDYKTTFAVYRAVGTGNNRSYQKVSNVTIVTWHGDEIIRSPAFNCYNVRINDFTINAGDFVAACVYNPSGPPRQLDIIGRTTTGYSLLRMNDESDCNGNSLPTNVLSRQLSNINSRILHVYATITVPTPPPTTTMSTTEQTTSVTWNMATTTASETTTTPSEAMATTTPSETMATTTPRETTTPSETTTMDVATTSSDGESSTTMMSSSTTANPTAQTTPGPTSETSSEEATTTGNSITTTQMEITTEAPTAASSTTSQTVGTTTVEPTTAQTMATIPEGTIDVTTSTTQPTTEISSITQAATTLSSDESTSAVSDMITIKDDVISTIAQISAQNNGSVDLTTIIGVIIAVVLLIVAGLVVAIIVAIVVKKRGKDIGGYSLPGKKPQSNGTANGVENLTYDVGFHNPGHLDSSFNLYDDVANAATVSGTGEGNYFEVTESGFSNLTYESVNASGIYSELSAAHMTSDTQANRIHHNPSQGVSCYQSEYYSSPHEDSTESLSFLLERNKQEDIYGNLEAYYAPASNEDEIYSQLNSCGTNSIPHVQIRILGHLGSGQFGNVEKGMWQSKEVALKTLKTDSTDEDKVKFLQEAAIMAQFSHPNIVTLHGVVSDKEPLMLVVELMHRGDLRDHLHSIRPDPGELPMAGLSEKLLSFSQHVALGMQYLSGKGFVHRDLAARNILVSKDNICKVADFGMSRDLADETYYVSHGGMIPVKWTAPEAIHYKKYSTASDVWSYGCLLYEIWSLGWKPFEGITNVEVIKILDCNKRLSPPPGCPRTIYEFMIKCWHPITGSRPRFRELTIILTGNRQDVLLIPQEALGAHKLAGVLGSPLEVGKNMYSDLRNKYCSENVYE